MEYLFELNKDQAGKELLIQLLPNINNKNNPTVMINFGYYPTDLNVYDMMYHKYHPNQFERYFAYAYINGECKIIAFDNDFNDVVVGTLGNFWKNSKNIYLTDEKFISSYSIDEYGLYDVSIDDDEMLEHTDIIHVIDDSYTLLSPLCKYGIKPHVNIINFDGSQSTHITSEFVKTKSVKDIFIYKRKLVDTLSKLPKLEDVAKEYKQEKIKKYSNKFVIIE